MKKTVITFLQVVYTAIFENFKNSFPKTKNRRLKSNTDSCFCKYIWKYIGSLDKTLKNCGNKFFSSQIVDVRKF